MIRPPMTLMLAPLVLALMLAACASRPDGEIAPVPVASARPAPAALPAPAPRPGPVDMYRVPLLDGVPARPLDGYGVVGYVLAMPQVDRDKLRAVIDTQVRSMRMVRPGERGGSARGVFVLPQRRGPRPFDPADVERMVRDYDFVAAHPLLARVVKPRDVRARSLFVVVASADLPARPAMVNAYDVTALSPAELADWLTRLLACLEAGEPLPAVERAAVSFRTVLSGLGRDIGQLRSSVQPSGAPG